MSGETIVSLIPSTIAMVVTAIFGLIVGILVEKFKNRFRTITYVVRTQKVAPAVSENLGGQLRITLNDREISNLRVTTVEIENNNSIDFENIVVTFTLGKGGIFQGNESFLVNNFHWIKWTDTFSAQFDKAVKELNALPINAQTGLRDTSHEFQAQIDFLNGNRQYVIPVFNRGERAIFNFLIEDNSQGTAADIFPSLIYKSINFVRKNEDPKKAQKDLLIGVSIGLMVVSIAVWVLVSKYPTERALIIWSAIIGFSYSIIGYAILISFRRLLQFFR